MTVEDGRHVGLSVRGKRFARHFLPSYTGSRGWVGLRLDAGPVDWEEVERLAVEAYLLVAPERLAAGVSGRSRSSGSP